MKKITFFNTFEPAVPLYRDSFPYLEEKLLIPEAVISACQYRVNAEVKVQPGRLKLLWVPNFVRHHKRWCALFYFVQATFFLFFLRSEKVF